MIPVLYPSNETDFRTNGIGRLVDAIKCKVIEERNGIYEAELVYPITGQHYKDIKEGCILWLIHDDTKIAQPFDIYAHTAPIDGIVTFRAHHISYRQSNIILKPFTAGSTAEAFAKINGYSANSNPFTYWTDKEVTGTFKVEAPVSVKEILGRKAGSILDVYGKGEYEWDGFDVKLYLNRGRDTGVQIRYGKNLSDITQEYDTSKMYSAVAPYWESADGEVVMLPEVIVIADNVPLEQGVLITHNRDPIVTDAGEEILYTKPIIQPVPLDLSGKWEEAPTEEQLRSEARKSLTNGWEPDENIKVDFVQLWQTEEYEQVAPLQRVRLCDMVSVYFPELGVVAKKQKVIRTEYNVLLERYDSMELGKAKTSFADALRASIETAIVKNVPTINSMKAAIDHATKLITGGLGGHVVIGTNADGQPNEILIMDTDNILTAVNVLRANVNGIGFSNSGYDGVYRSAWTLDGHFVADFIDTGTLNANLIKAGILTDVAGKHYWNMLTGDMQIGNIHVGDDQIYSGDKSTFGSTENGFYLGSNGDFSLGDSSNYLKWDSNQNTLNMRVSSLSIGGVDIETAIGDIAEDISDMVDDIDDAKKYATNYLYFDSANGLVISQTGEASNGYNTQINDSAVNIRYGTSVLSSLTSSGYTIYRGVTGLPAMALTGTALNFYKPDGQTVAATIGSQGLQVESGAIGGFHVTSSQNTGSSIFGGHKYPYSLYHHAGDGVDWEYEAGIKGDARENPDSPDTSHNNFSFYVGRIPKGDDWANLELLFYVRNNGSVYCADIDATGRITAKSGYIGNGVNGFTITDTAIYNGTNAINSTRQGIYLGTDGIRLYKSNTAHITMTNGVLTAVGADISGTITARNGEIGGFDISATQIACTYTTSTKSYKAYLNKGTAQTHDAFAVCITENNDEDYPFRVRYDGFLYASNANIKGTITADTGKIGGANGFTIEAEKIYNGTNSLTSTAQGVYLGTDGFRQYESSTSNVTITAGKITAYGAEIKGKIDAETGSIGNFEIDANQLYYGNNSPGTANTFYLAPKGTADPFDFFNPTATVAGVSRSDWVLTVGANYGITKNNGFFATAGNIGGWSIGAKTLTSSGTYNNESFAVELNAFQRPTTKAISVTYGTNSFSVDYQGKMTAVNATVTGVITADDGAIGGWVISQNKITGMTIELDSANGWLKFGSFTATTARDKAYIDSMGDGSLGTISFTKINVGELSQNLQWAFTASKTSAEMNVRCDFYVAPRFQNLSSTSTHNASFIVSDNIATLSMTQSSSRRYKEISRDMTHEDVEKAYNIQPVLAKMKEGYLDKRDERYGKYYPMLVAENVDENIPDAADHLNGRVENWNDRIMTVLHQQMLIDQHNQIIALRRKVEALQTTINALKQAVM